MFCSIIFKSVIIRVLLAWTCIYSLILLTPSRRWLKICGVVQALWVVGHTFRVDSWHKLSWGYRHKEELEEGFIIL